MANSAVDFAPFGRCAVKLCSAGPLYVSLPSILHKNFLMSKLSQTKINVLNEFEARVDEWSFGEFEKALQDAMGKNYGNYQTAKMTVMDADKDGRWSNTVKRSVLSNYRAFGSSPVELVDIFNRIWSGLTEQERSYWKPEAK